MLGKDGERILPEGGNDQRGGGGTDAADQSAAQIALDAQERGRDPQLTGGTLELTPVGTVLRPGAGENSLSRFFERLCFEIYRSISYFLISRFRSIKFKSYYTRPEKYVNSIFVYDYTIFNNPVFTCHVMNQANSKLIICFTGRHFGVPLLFFSIFFQNRRFPPTKTASTE